MLILHHNDADGRCAAHLIYEMRNTICAPQEKMHFIEMTYEKAVPFDKIKPSELVFIVDFSISPSDMEKLLSITINVIWIDHHISAINKYREFKRGEAISGIRYNGIAGCMLTWCYLNKMMKKYNPLETKVNFSKEMCNDAPLYVKLIADFDVWKFEYGEMTRKFIIYVYGSDTTPTSSFWEDVQTKDIRELINIAEIMLQYRDAWAQNYLANGFEVNFEGYKCFALNLGNCNSEYFKSLPKGKYDILIPFVFLGNIYRVSLYSETVDVSEIAVKYGGGGHVKASGFQCTELPFKKS